MDNQLIVGVLTLREPTVFRNSYECARWYQDVEVPTGMYEVVGHWDHTMDRLKGYSVTLRGKVVGSDFTSLWCGMPIPGAPDGINRDVGKEATHVIPGWYSGYCWALGLMGDELYSRMPERYALAPEYEPVWVDFIGIDGAQVRTAAIVRRGAYPKYKEHTYVTREGVTRTHAAGIDVAHEEALREVVA
jgi:hypothetical protein